MIHIDLFSGIGGFALAIDNVYEEKNTHTFVENDPFCQAVLRKHWPEAEIHGDIRTFTNAESARQLREKQHENSNQSQQRRSTDDTFKENTKSQIDILTGGFPCQPFSQAGVRRGTADDRYLWPEMLRVISEFKPKWVIAENVRGLLTIQNGMVFEQVCADLEKENYEVRAFIIPACATGAPHRRDRVWIVAHAISTGAGSEGRAATDQRGGASKDRRESVRQTYGEVGASGTDSTDRNTQNPISKRSSGRLESNGQVLERESPEIKDAGSSWESNWPEVAQRLCRMDDGLPARLGGLGREDYKLYPWWRAQALKAYGNAIVPQIAEMIMRAIAESH